MLRSGLILSLILIAATLQTAASQILDVREHSYELTLKDVRMPRYAAGAVSFTPCSSCEPKSLLVGPDTTYLIGDEALALPDFLKRVDALKVQHVSPGAFFVGIYYDIGTERVNRILLVDLREGAQANGDTGQ